jgi:4'-phosphopantetheinyl transferase
MDGLAQTHLRIEPDDWWLPVPEPLTLSHDEVHVWRASLDVAARHMQTLRRTLTLDEVTRAERFVYARDRERFILARGLLRAILARYLNVAPEQLRFRYGASGKPALAAESGGDGIHFNVSHSQGLVLCAVALNRKVGVDVEYVHPIPEAGQLVASFFSFSERAEFGVLGPDDQLGAFFRCWTRKEAYIKGKGKGLALALDRFDVSLVPGEPKLLNVDGDPWEASRWCLCELLPADGYVATLAVEGHDWHLSCWQWTE